MIPLSQKETVTFTDVDGVTWTFKPKTHALEMLIVEKTKNSEAISAEESMKVNEDLFNEIVKGWSDPKNRLQPYPADGRPFTLFNSEERVVIYGYWNEANHLPAEQKKS